MKDLSKVKKSNKGYYIERIRKRGKRKGQIARYYGHLRICKACGKKHFTEGIRKGYGNFCSLSCANKGENNNFYKKTGKFHPTWEGGKKHRPDGYIRVLNPQHPYCEKDGYILEHRLIMEKHLGRYLKHEEVVHHKDRNPSNNKYSNLILFKNQAEHARFENPFKGKD